VVARDQQRRGVEFEPERFVVLQDTDLAELEPEASRDITVKQFVSPEQINHQWYVRPYYLGPDGEQTEYFALAAAMAHQGVEGVARWTMRKKDYVGALRAEGEYLMLVTLRHAGEVVAPEQLEPPAGRDLDERELKMARQLLTALEEPFDPNAYRDQYRQRVLDFVQRKAAGETAEPEQPKAKQPAGDSLADVLEMSLAGVEGERHG
jgi:DNA end-binding protein Ku